MASGSEFSYAIATDPTTPPADADMVAFYIQPSKMPMFQPYGIPRLGSDGSILYSGKPLLRVSFYGQTFDKGTDDSVTTLITVKQLYVDWRTAYNQYSQRFWFTWYNPDDTAWHKSLGAMMWPNWSGKQQGKAFVNFEIEFQALDVDITSYTGGETTVPTGTGPGTYGDGWVGSYGSGRFGRGKFGRGELAG